MTKRFETCPVIYVAMLFFMLLSGVPYAEAANRYVRAGATGTGTGSDWTNAYPSLPTTLTRGDTYYVADGTYGGYTFDDPANGVMVITIKKATAADHGTDTGWSAAFGDGVATFTSSLEFVTPYYTVNGQVGGGPGAWKTGHGFRTRTTDNGVSVNPQFSGSAHHISILHIEIDGAATGVGAGDGLFAVLTDDITLSYAYVHHIGNAPLQINSVDRLRVEYSYFGVFYSNAGSHSEICSCDGISDTTFAYNLFTHAESTGGLVLHTNSPHGVYIYGNVFYESTTPWTYGNNGLIGGWTSANNLVNVKVYNNTFVGLANPSVVFGFTPQGSVSGNEIRNNYFHNVKSPTGLPSGHWGTVTHNHFNSSGAPVGSNASTSSGDPFINIPNLDFMLTGATPTGVSLASPFNKDMLGFVRSSWNRGAMESPIGARLPPPTNLRLTSTP